MALKGHSLKHGYGLMLAKASGHGGRPNHHTPLKAMKWLKKDGWGGQQGQLGLASLHTP